MSGENEWRKSCKDVCCKTNCLQYIYNENNKVKKRQNILLSRIVYNADIPVCNLFKNEI